MTMTTVMVDGRPEAKLAIDRKTQSLLSTAYERAMKYLVDHEKEPAPTYLSMYIYIYIHM